MNDLDDIVKVHTTGFNLQDVKVQFDHDVKIDVSGVHVEGKQGEILNLPRWVANIVESEKHGRIQDIDMSAELKQAVTKEKGNGEFELIELDSRFYIHMRDYMKRLPESDNIKLGSLLNYLVRKRRGKIIRLADSLKLSSEIKQKLTVEEIVFYNTIYENSENFKKRVLGEYHDKC